jgi:hypothetical protein
MAKRLGPGKCVHYLKDVDKRNSDHVFPVSWYPDSTPPNLWKWQIPSCIPCNTAYGKLERDFMLKVGPLDPYDPASASIVQKALRTLKPAHARDERDALHRHRKRQKILAEALDGDRVPDHGHFPGLHDRWKDIPGGRSAILIPAQSFERITEKIVRGIFYIEEKKFIEPPYKIDFFALAEEDAVLIEQMLDKFGTIYAREPGVVVHRAVAPEDGSAHSSLSLSGSNLRRMPRLAAHNRREAGGAPGIRTNPAPGTVDPASPSHERATRGYADAPAAAALVTGRGAGEWARRSYPATLAAEQVTGARAPKGRKPHTYPKPHDVLYATRRYHADWPSAASFSDV